MLLRKEVTHATDLDLLTAIIGNRAAATKLFAKAHLSLFALLHLMPHENGVTLISSIDQSPARASTKAE